MSNKLFLNKDKTNAVLCCFGILLYDKKYFQSLFAIFFGTLIIFIPGIIWLGFWFDNFHPKLAENIGLFEGYKLALTHGLLVFKFTEPVKVALAASITPLLWQYISKK